MDKILKQFQSRAIIKSNLLLFTKKDALTIIRSCEEQGLSLLGIDGFFLNESTIQPSMDNSIDGSFGKFKERNIYDEAFRFIHAIQEELYFEIVIQD